jgi:ribosomal protein S18 acetylase RimI-like enzyme
MDVRRVTSGTIGARQATLEDVELLTSLCGGGFPDTLLWGGPRFRSRNWWRYALRSSWGETWVFSIDGEPSGLCVLVREMNRWQADVLPAERNRAARLCAAVLCPKLVFWRLAKTVLGAGSPPSECPKSEAVRTASGRRTRIRLLAVAPCKRRQGVGRQMLQFCENRTLELGYKIIDLFVFAENAPARRLYVEQGYVCTDHRLSGCVFTKVLGASRPLPVRGNAEPS